MQNQETKSKPSTPEQPENKRLDETVYSASFTSVEEAKEIIQNLTTGLNIGIKLASIHFANLMKKVS